MSRVFKRCLITGIGGSGGSYLAEHILKRSPATKIFGFRRSIGYSAYLKKKYKSKISITKIDLNNFKNLKKKISIIKPDVIFHLASNADVRNSFFEPLKFSENNNMITINLLEALKQLKSNSIIIICSTSEVYGNVEKKNMPIKETQQIAPINPYAVTKVFQDLMSQVYEKTFDMNVIITRMFSYMNPRRNNLFQTAFANQIAAICCVSFIGIFFFSTFPYTSDVLQIIIIALDLSCFKASNKLTVIILLFSENFKGSKNEFLTSALEAK